MMQLKYTINLLYQHTTRGFILSKLKLFFYNHLFTFFASVLILLIYLYLNMRTGFAMS